MKTQHLKWTFLCLAVLAGSCALAQESQPADDWKPATSNQRGKQYPQVNSEGRVKARIVAPQATNVALQFLGGATYPFTKGDDGAWVGVTRPQDEGFHYYQLLIDGAGVPDPGSLYFYGGNRWGSGVEVPAKDQNFYAVKDVPHGQLRQVLYPSKSAHATLRCFVYTPARLRQEPVDALSRVVSPARRRRGRDRLGQSGERGTHHGQPDRRGQSQALHHRDGQ